VRTFKFRGWHQTAKEMVYDENFGDVLRWYREGQPLEIMQYTGLKDRNGKEIYEGDVTRGGAYLHQIVWMDDKANYGAKVIRGEGVLVRNLTFPLRYVDALEVIGNIYENTDLLEANT